MAVLYSIMHVSLCVYTHTYAYNIHIYVYIYTQRPLLLYLFVHWWIHGCFPVLAIVNNAAMNVGCRCIFFKLLLLLILTVSPEVEFLLLPFHSVFFYPPVALSRLDFTYWNYACEHLEKILSWYQWHWFSNVWVHNTHMQERVGKSAILRQFSQCSILSSILGTGFAWNPRFWMMAY